MRSGISGTENIPYASVCPIEELTPHLGTHLEVVGFYPILTCITHDYLAIQGSAAPLERW